MNTAQGAVGSDGRQAAVAGGRDRRDLVRARAPRRGLTGGATSSIDATSMAALWPTRNARIRYSAVSSNVATAVEPIRARNPRKAGLPAAAARYQPYNGSR